MRQSCAISYIIIIVIFINTHTTNGQFPQRLQIPGALLIDDTRPIVYKQQRFPAQDVRFRRPNPTIRPVIEEVEEPATNTFDEEVSKLELTALQDAVRQNSPVEKEQQTLRPQNIQFRPERPVPILRQAIRENLGAGPGPVPHVRQENIPIQRPPVLRQQEDREENYPIRQPQSNRQQYRQQIPQTVQQPQVYRQPARVAQSPRPIHQQDDEDNRTRKPPVQILRKYRTDNPDGSITWGYENEDGSFKDETLGVDCVIKGKYGYVDPDGVKREYSYETGNKCDPTQEDEDELLQKEKQPYSNSLNHQQQQQRHQQPQPQLQQHQQQHQQQQQHHHQQQPLRKVQYRQAPLQE